MPSKVLPVNWAEIRVLAEQGVAAKKIAETYEIGVMAIYKRSEREGWVTPHKVNANASKLRQLAVMKGHGGCRQNPPSGPLGLSEKAALTLGETWEERQQKVRHIAYDVAMRALQEAKDSPGPMLIETAQDLKNVVHVARQATGLDADTPAVSLSIFGNSGALDSNGYGETLDGFVEATENSDDWL